MTTEILYVKSLPTPWHDMKKKTDLKRTWCFLRANKNYLLQKLFWGVQCIKCVYNVCSAAIWFCCASH